MKMSKGKLAFWIILFATIATVATISIIKFN
jgi:hypothetical protein